ncbi:MAG: indolepyruvate oxidoreductase subunit beta [Ktedonobacterales bacterium]
MKRPLNFLLVGVGGQGTILASDILVRVGLAAGYQVKQAEVHGMSQRGGSVTSYVRWDEVVYSPLVGEGEVDVLLAFEKLEALRYLAHLRQDALALINLETIIPITVSSLGLHYPDDNVLRAAFASVTSHAVYVDGPAIATVFGEPKVANTALIGALSRLLEEQAPPSPELTQSIWLEVLAGRVPPPSVDLNRLAFFAGRDSVLVPA